MLYDVVRPDILRSFALVFFGLFLIFGNCSNFHVNLQENSLVPCSVLYEFLVVFPVQYGLVFFIFDVHLLLYDVIQLLIVCLHVLLIMSMVFVSLQSKHHMLTFAYNRISSPAQSFDSRLYCQNNLGIDGSCYISRLLADHYGLSVF